MWELSLAQTKGRDSAGLPVGQPCSESLSPNLEVKGKSVFLKLHCMELWWLQIISGLLCSWNINCLCYFCGYRGKFYPFCSSSASPKPIVDPMGSGFVIALNSCSGSFAWTRSSARWGQLGRLGKVSSCRDIVLNQRVEQSCMQAMCVGGGACLYRGGWRQELVYWLVGLMGADY